VSGIARAEPARVTGGTLTLDGESLRGLTPDRIARRGVALVPERDKVFASLTVDENLGVVPNFGSRAQRQSRREFVLDLFPQLGDRVSTPAGLLSGGERQMLALGRALMLQPSLLLADELSFGIAPVLVGRMMEALRVIHRETGVSILLVEQNATALFSVADFVYVMEIGRVVQSGSTDTMKENPRVRSLFLGGHSDGVDAHA
jgi:branched-chain amino acid transport system ATP-binding protein